MSRPVRTTRRSTRNSLNNTLESVGGDQPAKIVARQTPRNSDVETIAPKDTPYTNLRQLAGLIQRPTTPQERANGSAQAVSTRASARQTPTNQERTPAVSAQKPGSTRRGIVTPHGLRAMQQRRAAALTPGRDRRRSDRVQRETPRDVLRGLSKLLANKSQPTEPTPPTGASTRSRLPITVEDDLEAEADPPKPRLSLALDEDDDSFHLPAPRLSAPLEDASSMDYSVELPRRALSAQPGSRLSRGSLGSIRMSDRFTDLNELGLDLPPNLVEDDSIVIQDPGAFEDEDEDLPDVEIASEPGEETRALQRAFFEEATRPSDVADEPSEVVEMDEDTFYIDVPQQELPSDQPNTSLQAQTALDSDSEVSRRDQEDEDGPDDLVTTQDVENDIEEENDDEGIEEDVEEMENDGAKDPGEADTTRMTGIEKSDATLDLRSKQEAKKEPKKSKHGITYPSLPTSAIKKMVSNYVRASGGRKAKLSKETIASIAQASDWFFEQVSDDLGAYARHAGRKTIDESDVILLMKRQKQLNANTTPFSLAQRHLPRELLQDVRIITPSLKSKPTRRKKLQTIDEEQEDE